MCVSYVCTQICKWGSLAYITQTFQAFCFRDGRQVAMVSLVLPQNIKKAMVGTWKNSYFLDCFRSLQELLLGSAAPTASHKESKAALHPRGSFKKSCGGWTDRLEPNATRSHLKSTWKQLRKTTDWRWLWGDHQVLVVFDVLERARDLSSCNGFKRNRTSERTSSSAVSWKAKLLSANGLQVAEQARRAKRRLNVLSSKLVMRHGLFLQLTNWKHYCKYTINDID